MKPAKNKTVWKRETSKSQPRTEFDNVVHALTSYSSSTRKGNLNKILVVLREHDSDKSGKTEELFSAVQNVLENLKLELIEAHSGVAEILCDVAALLVETRTKTALEQESARFDELLERLDFVASGGTDEEVPRVEEAKATSQPANFVPQLPIVRPKNFEDPMVAHLSDRLSSLNTILSVRSFKNDVPGKQLRLQVEQLQLAEYCLRAVEHETTIELEELASELTEVISKFFEEKTNQPLDLVHFDATGGVLYRSLAQIFRWYLRDLAITIGVELVSRSEAKIQITTHSNHSDISLNIEFSGLRTAFDLISQRMEELSATHEDIPLREQFVPTEEILSQSTKTRKERIAHSLVQIRRFVDCAQGQMRISNKDEHQLIVNIKLPRKARVLHALPIVVGSDTFLLESHLLAGVVDTTKVCWDESHSNIKYANNNYQYCLIDDNTRPCKPNKDTPTWVLLIDTMDRKVALEVETIGKPELQVSVPSVSEIQYGHRLLGENRLRLLIDPMELRPLGRSDVITNKDPTTHYLCFHVSETLENKIKRCIDNKPNIVRHTSTLADTISQLQEYCPDFLIIEECTDEFRTIDALQRIGNTIRSLKVKVVLFAASSTQPVEQMNNVSFDVAYLSKDADFRELKNVFVPNRDSAKSASELEHG